jgi:hypothetical protein
LAGPDLSPDDYDFLATRQWAEEAFELMNKHEVDTVDELPAKDRAWLTRGLADTLWPLPPTFDAEKTKTNAAGITAGTMMAERLRRDYRAVTGLAGPPT